MQPGRGPYQIRHNFISKSTFFSQTSISVIIVMFTLTLFIVVVIWLCFNVAEKRELGVAKTPNFLPFLLLCKWLLQTVQPWHFFLPVYSVFVIILILFIDSFWARKDRRFCWQNYWDIITFQDLSFLSIFIWIQLLVQEFIFS